MRRPKLWQVAEALGHKVGCGDNSCVWGSPGGMATNGGCRCYGRRGEQDDRVGLLLMADVARALLQYRTLDEIISAAPATIEGAL